MKGDKRSPIVALGLRDELTQNRDRNQGNILWTNAWTMWLIDPRARSGSETSS